MTRHKRAQAAIPTRVEQGQEDTSQSAISKDLRRTNRVTSLRFTVVPRENRARGHVRDITPGCEFLAFQPTFPRARRGPSEAARLGGEKNQRD